MSLLTVDYSSLTRSRIDRLHNFSLAIEKNQGQQEGLFQGLHREDRAKILSIFTADGFSGFSQTEMTKQPTLKGRVQTEIRSLQEKLKEADSLEMSRKNQLQQLNNEKRSTTKKIQKLESDYLTCTRDAEILETRIIQVDRSKKWFELAKIICLIFTAVFGNFFDVEEQRLEVQKSSYQRSLEVANENSRLIQNEIEKLNNRLFEIDKTLKGERGFTLGSSTLQEDHIQKVPIPVMSSALGQFLSPTEMDNLHQSYKNTPTASSSAASIIKTNHLEPFIETYLHLSCKDLTKTEQATALKQLMAMVQELSKLEKLEVPSYQSIGEFFKLVEARNLLRMAAEIHSAEPLLGLEGAQLEIAKDSESTLNRAEKIREWFGQHQASLSAVKRLRLSDCRLTLLPPEIGQLRALDHLDLERNQLTSLTKEIGQLGALTRLELGYNHLTNLPKEIRQLGALTTLYVSNNHLTNLPKEIGQLWSLTDLKLNKNRLTSLPKEIEQLGALEYVWLSDNRLKNVPEMIKQLVPWIKLCFA